MQGGGDEMDRGSEERKGWKRREGTFERRGGSRRHFSRPPGCAASLHGILRGCKISLSFFLRSMRWRNRDKANSSSQDAKRSEFWSVWFRPLWTTLATKGVFKTTDFSFFFLFFGTVILHFCGSFI